MDTFKNPWEITPDMLKNPWEVGNGNSVLDREGKEDIARDGDISNIKQIYQNRLTGTEYFATDGTLLHLSMDKLQRAVTIVGDDKIALFKEGLSAAKKIGLENDEQTNKKARMITGLTYNLSSIVKFYNDNVHRYVAKKIGADLVSKFEKIELNNKPYKPYSEVNAHLILTSNKMVVVGRETSTTYNMQSCERDMIPKEANVVATIHSHPFSDIITLNAKVKSGTLTGMWETLSFTAGPSYPEDYGAVMSGNMYWDVMVDAKNIYFYNKTKTIKVAR